MSRDDNFLSRWSRRKIAARGDNPLPETATPTPEAGRTASTAGVVPASAGTHASPVTNQQPSDPLPPVDSLTFDSDFTGFMREGVDPDLRRAAIRTLVRDPRFNVMDGLDVYIDDYSKPDPLPPEWLDKLNQLKNLGHPVDEPGQGGDEKGDSAPREAPPIEEKSPAAEISEDDISVAPQQPKQGLETPDGDQ